MAQQTQVLLIDDIDGGEAHDTVSFGLDGENYEIDLATPKANDLRGILARYAEHARPVRMSAPERTPARRSSRASHARHPRGAGFPRPTMTEAGGAPEPTTEREWLRWKGHSVGQAGRLGKELHALWEAHVSGSAEKGSTATPPPVTFAASSGEAEGAP
jgi:hypothetical protein